MVKPRLYSDTDDSKDAAIWTLKYVLNTSLKLLHPYMPFITDEIYTTLKEAEGVSTQDLSIMVSDWPAYNKEYDFKKEENAVEIIKNAVKEIRNTRSEMNVPPSKKTLVYIVSEDESMRHIFADNKVFFATLGYATEVHVQGDKESIDDDFVSVVIPKATIYIPFSELVDSKKEIERLEKEKKKLKGELKRVNGMLSNEKFVSKAPPAKIEEEKAKKEKYTDMMKQVLERLEYFKK